MHTLATPATIATGLLKIGAHDSRRGHHRRTPGGDPTGDVGRHQQRGRIILSERLTDLTGLVPGTYPRYDVLDTGQLILTSLPNQDAARLAWNIDRILAMKQAHDLQAWAIEISTVDRAHRRAGHAAPPPDDLSIDRIERHLNTCPVCLTAFALV